jgi:dienelactone hydrolase
LAEVGVVVVEGHPLTQAAYSSIARIELSELEAPFRGRAFIAQVSARQQDAPRRDVDSLRRALRSGAIALVQAPPPWQENDEYAIRPEHLFASTLEWIASQSAIGSHPNAALTLTPLDRELRSSQDEVEQPVTLPSANGMLRAILHLPAQVDAARPAIIMLTPGFNCRTARYRLYVKIARTLAACGWVVLRADPHGIGDSDGSLPYTRVADLYGALERGLFVQDAQAAISFLQAELDVRSVLSFGLCGGAVTSLLLAGRDARVVGVAALEVPFTLTPQARTEPQTQLALGAADSFLRSYAKKALDPTSWRRFLLAQSDYRGLARSLKTAVGRRLWRGFVSEDVTWFRDRLGPSANLEMIESLRECMARRVPVLCVFGNTRNSWHFNEILPALRRSGRGVEPPLRVVTIEGADHGFSLPLHEQAATRAVASWAETLVDGVSTDRPEFDRQNASST